MNQNIENILKDKEIIINSLNIKYFVKKLKEEIENGYIQKVQKINAEKNLLKIKINTEKANYIFITGEGIAINTKYNPEVEKINKGFSLKLNQKLKNKKIIKIEQINEEKIILFELGEFNLYIELFSHNNIILTDKSNKIIDSLYKEKWKDRTIKPNYLYILPKSNYINPNYINNIKKTEKNIISNFLNYFNISPNILELIINKLNINKENYSDNDINLLLKELQKLYNSEFDEEKTYYIIKNKKIELYNNKYLENIIKTKFNKNLIKIIDDFYLKNIFEERINKLYEKKQKEINKIKAIINSQEKKIKEFEEKSKKYKEAGDLIYENYDKIDEILKTIKKQREKGLSFEEIENIFNKNKEKIELLKIFKKIDKKNKKVIFTLHHRQQ